MESDCLNRSMSAQGVIFFCECFLVPFSGLEAFLKRSLKFTINEVNPTFMAEERIWRPKRSRQSLSIVFIQNVKVLGNSHQKPEADMCRQLSIVSQDAVENRSGACRKISYDELDT